MAPIVDGLAKQYEGKVAVRKINTDTDPAALKYAVQKIPTYIFIDSSGTVLDTVVGGNPDGLTKGFERAAAAR